VRNFFEKISFSAGRTMQAESSQQQKTGGAAAFFEQSSPREPFYNAHLISVVRDDQDMLG
jgi:hypothetical protein